MGGGSGGHLSVGEQSFVRELFGRRVPHIGGAYVAGSAGIVQFVDWLAGRYALSPALIDFALLLLVLLLPTVLLLAWRHGQPGRNRWTGLERVGVPANLLVAGAVLALSFGGRSLGATTTTVIVEDEEGNEVEAVVAKSEFRRHLALFYFDNESGDAELDWLQYGIPRGLWADWRQDIFMSVREGLALSQALRENGQPDGLGLPLGLKSTIAEKQNVDYFLGGEISRGANGPSVVTSLYEVGSNRLVAERTHTGAPFDLIDQISAQVREDMGIPTQRLSEAADLPLDELLTDSEVAYRAYAEAFKALAVDSDYGQAAQSVGQAVEEDPSFALAHWLRYAIAVLSNQSETAVEAINATMEHSYRLPEREKYYVRREYHYLVGQDPEKGIQLAEMSVTMNPEDIEARGALALLYRASNRVEDEIEQYLEILRFSPSQSQVLLAVGDAYRRTGQYEQAIDYIARYSELAPQDMQAYPILSQSYGAIGQFEDARAACERALLLEPQNVSARLCLAGIAYDLADWPEAERLYDDAEGLARTAADRAAMYEARAGYHVRRGQIEAAIEDRALELPLLSQAGAPPLQVLQRRLQTLTRFVLAQRPEAALDSAAALAAQFEAPFDQLSGIGELAIYNLIGDPDGLEAAIAKVEGVIQTLGVEALRSNVVFAGGRVLELRGDCASALSEYRRAIEMDPAATAWGRAAARCLRTLGRADEAASELEPVFVRSPNAPRSLVELAMIESERGNLDLAVAHLERALDVWAGADPGYAPAEEARSLLAGLAGG
ncbi:MAG: tetratricopeptide repeat protein [Gemmatimonadota bacterium]|nr:tetratricopeptide repeat protein [Gemmatimonadota bacterium]